MVNPAEQQWLFIAVTAMLLTSLVVMIVWFVRSRGGGSGQNPWYAPNGEHREETPPTQQNTSNGRGFWADPNGAGPRGPEDSPDWPTSQNPGDASSGGFLADPGSTPPTDGGSDTDGGDPGTTPPPPGEPDRDR